jgi:RNA polymerase sigma-70 factor, ECF subfamily
MDQHDPMQIELSQNRDQRELALLYERYSRLVYGVALAILRSPALAEDVLQEIFLQLWRSPDQFLPVKRDLSPWLAVVTKNRCIDQLRQMRRLVSMDELVLVSPLDLAHNTEQFLLQEKTKSSLGRLTSDQRIAIYLAFHKNHTHMEISKLTGCPLGTIKSRIRTGLKHLRESLEAKETPRRPTADIV